MLKKSISIFAVAMAIVLSAANAQDKMKKESGVMVGGAMMVKSKNIVENALNSKDHTTLVAAVKAAGLVETLSSPGPFTVFAPTNAAFEKLPAGTVDNLLKPENKNQLVKVLTYHVVPGKLSAKEITEKVKAANNKLSLKTVEGANLTVSLEGGSVWLIDESGNKSKVTIADVNQSNG